MEKETLKITRNLGSIPSPGEGCDKFIRDFNRPGKLIAAICHALVVLASADILKGRKLTGYRNIQVDLKNAGGTVLEQPRCN